MQPGELKGKVLAIPGTMTSAFLIMRLFQPDFTPVVVPFDRIFEAVAEDRADAGLIIHEGHIDLFQPGPARRDRPGGVVAPGNRLPLPLGGNAIRKDLGRPPFDELPGSSSRVFNTGWTTVPRPWTMP